MSIESHDFINLANRLLNDKDYTDEATFRTIISRSYYGCFLYLIPLLGFSYITYFKKDKIGKIHQKVIDTLKDRDPISGSYLESLRRSRNKSDYFPDEDVLINEVKNSIHLARHIMANI